MNYKIILIDLDLGMLLVVRLLLFEAIRLLCFPVVFPISVWVRISVLLKVFSIYPHNPAPIISLIPGALLNTLFHAHHIFYIQDFFYWCNGPVLSRKVSCAYFYRNTLLMTLTFSPLASKPIIADIYILSRVYFKYLFRCFYDGDIKFSKKNREYKRVTKHTQNSHRGL